MALTCCGYQSLFKLLHALSRICFRLQEKDPRYFFLNHFSCKLNYASVIYSSWGFINQLSMDWFKGKNTGKPPYFMGKSMASCRFSLQPIETHRAGGAQYWSNRPKSSLAVAPFGALSLSRPSPVPGRRCWMPENHVSFFQWEPQDPKMEVLYHIKPYFGCIPVHSPYIGLIYGRYLQFRFWNGCWFLITLSPKYGVWWIYLWSIVYLWGLSYL